MSALKLSWLTLTVSAIFLFSSCGFGGQPVTSVSPTSESSPTTSPTAEPTAATLSPVESAAPAPPDPAEPVPKVERTDQPNQPEFSAAPVDPAEQVRYSDGVRLAITDVTFRVEEAKGPGAFPGRELALLSLEILNGGEEPISLDTVVVTVLDAEGETAAPMSAPDDGVRDFAGIVRPGDSSQARYAFAVPSEARSEVTVVVDFDGRHASAVFRGSLD